MRPQICPSKQQLQAFQLGDLPVGSLDEVADHLESCPKCETIARQLDTELDPILAALRKPSTPIGRGGTRLLSPGSVAPDHGSASSETTAYPFLHPPVEADEIGRLGNYRVLRLLGKGGMAFVFRAEDIALGRPVALKVMKPDLHPDADSWQRFLREARIMAAIKHEHLVTVYQAGEDGGAVYLAMELLEGETLGDRLDRQRIHDVAEILRLGRELTSGLAVIHRHGLIHRDIKPDNVFLVSSGVVSAGVVSAGVVSGKSSQLRTHPSPLTTHHSPTVKILDFGLARFVNDDSRLTQAGTVMGTPAFMAPEQARGQAVDGRGDLYSLGAILYYLCTGRRPFHADNIMAILTALAVDNPRPVHELNPAIPLPLADLIMAVLAKEPGARPASAEAVLDRLAQVEALLADPSATQLSFRTRGTRIRRAWTNVFGSRRRALVIVAAILVLASLVVVKWIPGSGQSARQALPAYPTVPGAIYLAELDPVDPVNFPFRGPIPGLPPQQEPADWPPPVGGRRVIVEGKIAPRGIWMHLPPPHERDTGTTSIGYRLNEEFRTFNVEMSLNDGPSHCIPLTFSIHGDGRLLWQSEPVSSQADRQSVLELSVKDIKLLTLQVTGTGNEMGTHAVWIEPYLTK